MKRDKLIFMAKQNGNSRAKNQPEYVLYEGTYVASWYPKVMIAFYIIATFWCIALFTTCDCDDEDFDNAISDEYSIPVSNVSDIRRWHFGEFSCEAHFFPIPSTSWYITTKTGEKVELASDYFGGDISLKKEAIDKYFLIDKAVAASNEWNEMWDSFDKEFDKKMESLRSDYNY